jgi:hypothetical protein
MSKVTLPGRARRPATPLAARGTLAAHAAAAADDDDDRADKADDVERASPCDPPPSEGLKA